MPRFLETICFENGIYPLLEWHQLRVDQVFSTFFPNYPPVNLHSILPKQSLPGRTKVRVVYNKHQQEISLAKYDIRPIENMQLVEAENLMDYSFKFEDRDALKMLFDERGTADDILIIQDNWVTDSYYANPVFWDGNQWFVPETCLLNGVRRQMLLDQGVVKVKPISIGQIWDYEKISLVNAMLDLGECLLGTSGIKKKVRRGADKP